MDNFSTASCKNALHIQLEKAKESLKGVDENLKRFMSKNFLSTPQLREIGTAKRKENDQQAEVRWRSNREERYNVANAANNSRRRPAAITEDVTHVPIKKRLGSKIPTRQLLRDPERPKREVHGESENEDDSVKPSVLSWVVIKPQVVPSRKEVLSCHADSQTKARDRRIFGSLLGTLQKFRQEEQKMKDKEEKKAKIERKLEEAARREKEQIRQERQKLMKIRRDRQAYIREVESNIERLKEFEMWEELQRPLFSFIETTTYPPIYYNPKEHNDSTSEKQKISQKNITKRIEDKREMIKKEVDAIVDQWEETEKKLKREGKIPEELEEMEIKEEKENALENLESDGSNEEKMEIEGFDQDKNEICDDKEETKVEISC